MKGRCHEVDYFVVLDIERTVLKGVQSLYTNVKSSKSQQYWWT